jgi:hypothetical protein
MRKGVTSWLTKEICERATKGLALPSTARRGALKGQRWSQYLSKIIINIVIIFGILKRPNSGLFSLYIKHMWSPFFSLF